MYQHPWAVQPTRTRGKQLACKGHECSCCRGLRPQGQTQRVQNLFSCRVSFNGRVPFTRAAGRWRSGATSHLAWRWGDVGKVSHLGSLGQAAHENETLPMQTSSFCLFLATSGKGPRCHTLSLDLNLPEFYICLNLVGESSQKRIQDFTTGWWPFGVVMLTSAVFDLHVRSRRSPEKGLAYVNRTLSLHNTDNTTKTFCTRKSFFPVAECPVPLEFHDPPQDSRLTFPDTIIV